jgi:alpha-N-arabinofuranosidase
MNPTDQEMELSPAVTGKTLSGNATRWNITGPTRAAHNTPGQPRVVDIQRTAGLDASDLRVPPLSAAVFRIPLR